MPVITLKPIRKTAPVVVVDDAPVTIASLKISSLTSQNHGLLKVASNHKLHALDMTRTVHTLHNLFVVPAIIRGDMETVWTYLDAEPFWVTCSSRCADVKSEITEYTNKKGESFMAHYTQHGNYLRRMKPGEEDGIYYNGNFPITRKTHKVKSDCSNATQLEHCFEGIYPLEPYHQ
jgi:hypothetical protein